MDLREFVAQSLIQITQAILEAQEATKAQGAVINPPLALFGSSVAHVNMEDYRNHIPQTINFDVLVNVESANASDKEGKIKIAVVSIGGATTLTEKLINSSRISFSLPVCWPPACDAKQVLQSRGGMQSHVVDNFDL